MSRLSAVEASVAAAEGKFVGPYELKAVLGRGSTGHVRLGVHRDTGQKVAVKIISRERLSLETDLQHKVEREIAILKLIKHPHVLSLYDVYESESCLYLVLEYVEGGELFDYLAQRGRLELDEALVFFQQIISAVDYCHSHFVCHRDLKPENLLLDSQNKLRIADFGMASLQHHGSMLDQSCGTPHYASPEVIRGIKYDGRAADVWSCGVILHALLTGVLPFDDNVMTKLLVKVKVGIFKMPDWLPADVQTLLRRILTVNPAKRYKIEDVKANPWFRSNGLFDSLRGPPVYTHLPSIPPGQPLDDDVLFSMRNLGCFSIEEDLAQSLAAKESNLEKIVYYLLLERKQSSPVSRDEELLEDQADRGEKIKKRTDKPMNNAKQDHSSVEDLEPLDSESDCGSGQLSMKDTRLSEAAITWQDNATEPTNNNSLCKSPPGRNLAARLSPKPSLPSSSLLCPQRLWFGDLFERSKETVSMGVAVKREALHDLLMSVCEANQLDVASVGQHRYKATLYPVKGGRPLVFQITVSCKRHPVSYVISFRLLYGFLEVFRELTSNLRKDITKLSALTFEPGAKFNGQAD